MEMRCKAFVVISQNIYKVPELIDGLPLYAENRLVIFVKSHRYLVTQFAMVSKKLFLFLFSLNSSISERVHTIFFFFRKKPIFLEI